MEDEIAPIGDSKEEEVGNAREEEVGNGREEEMGNSKEEEVGNAKEEERHLVQAPEGRRFHLGKFLSIYLIPTSILVGFIVLGSIVDRIVKRVDRIGQTVERMDRIGHTVDHIGQTVDRIGQKVDRIGDKVDGIGKLVDIVETTLEDGIHHSKDFLDNPAVTLRIGPIPVAKFKIEH